MAHASELTCSHDFGPFDGRIWLNSAGQGPLPHIAAEAMREALSWKEAPHRVPEGSFRKVPLRLKRALGQLIGAPSEDIILGNSATYGLHLLAQGFPWQEGDEVLLLDEEFPTTVLSWLPLRERGVDVRLVHPQRSPLEPDELVGYFSPTTRLFAVSWVNSFLGHAIDLQAIGEVCHANDVLFVVNGSQAFGARAIDISALPVDAVSSCGAKWLCGPVGTGFCWMRPDLREMLTYKQPYWLNNMHGDDFTENMLNYTLRDDLGAAAYDVFATANYPCFLPWVAAVEYLLAQGIPAIERHNDALVARLLDGLDKAHYDVISPREGPARSTVVIITHKEPEQNVAIGQALDQEGVDISIREGNLRLSPHLHNVDNNIDRTLAILNSF